MFLEKVVPVVAVLTTVFLVVCFLTQSVSQTSRNDFFGETCALVQEDL